MRQPTILLIEPDKLFAQTYKKALEASDYTVFLVTNAQEAISCADAHKPDLVVLEVELAKHNGIEFLYEFRSYPEWQSIPVIINTNISRGKFAASSNELQLLGVSELLYKPKSSLAKLISILANELEYATAND